jgi:hypothetical protein
MTACPAFTVVIAGLITWTEEEIPNLLRRLRGLSDHEADASPDSTSHREPG